MSRATQRAGVVTALTNLGLFDQVLTGAQRSLDGRSPVAIVLSRSIAINDLSRGMGGDERVYGTSVGVYVRADVGQESAAESALDALAEAAAAALRTAGYRVTGSDAAAEGSPLREADGVFYRYERLLVETQEYD